jgi:hypothetical protein
MAQAALYINKSTMLFLVKAICVQYNKVQMMCRKLEKCSQIKTKIT